MISERFFESNFFLWIEPFLIQGRKIPNWANRTSTKSSTKKRNIEGAEYCEKSDKWKKRTEHEKGFELTDVDSSTDYGERNAVLSTDEYNFFLNDKRFSLDKAIELKPKWATGKKPKETALSYKGTKGYSHETIKQYYKAFKRLLSPTEPTGGGA
jgi:hypothetical protein